MCTIGTTPIGPNSRFLTTLRLPTSEAERIFSLMNDIKTSERSRLGQRNLAALMFWHYHGKDLKPWQLPVQDILKSC